MRKNLLAHASAAEKTLHGPNLVLVVRVQDIGLVATGADLVDLHQVAGQLLADLRPEIGIETQDVLAVDRDLARRDFDVRQALPGRRGDGVSIRGCIGDELAPVASGSFAVATA